jgi:hypothetical protein
MTPSHPKAFCLFHYIPNAQIHPSEIKKVIIFPYNLAFSPYSLQVAVHHPPGMATEVDFSPAAPVLELGSWVVKAEAHRNLVCSSGSTIFFRSRRMVDQSVRSCI